MPDESVGRQDLPLDETVANTKVIRLLLSLIGAKNGWFIQKSMELSKNQVPGHTGDYSTVPGHHDDYITGL